MRTKRSYWFLERSQSSGFTLIELVLVVLVLGVIAGLAIPNFSRSYLQFQLQQSTEDIAYLMRYAQGRAVAKNQVVRLAFDEEFKSYRLLQNINEEDSGESGPFVPIDGRMGKKIEIPKDLSLETTDASIFFYPDGTIDRQRIYVCLKDNCRTISSQEQRGFVQIFNSKVE